MSIAKSVVQHQSITIRMSASWGEVPESICLVGIALRLSESTERTDTMLPSFMWRTGQRARLGRVSSDEPEDNSP